MASYLAIDAARLGIADWRAKLAALPDEVGHVVTPYPEADDSVSGLETLWLIRQNRGTWQGPPVSISNVRRSSADQFLLCGCRLRSRRVCRPVQLCFQANAITNCVKYSSWAWINKSIHAWRVRSRTLSEQTSSDIQNSQSDVSFAQYNCICYGTQITNFVNSDIPKD